MLRSLVEVGWPNGRAPVLQTGRESSILSPTINDGRPRGMTDDRGGMTDDTTPKTDDRRQTTEVCVIVHRSSVVSPSQICRRSSMGRATVS